MVTKNEALRIKHISQYCEEIGKDCDNCLFTKVEYPNYIIKPKERWYGQGKIWRKN